MAANFTTKMNLANFTCKFGEKFVMLDLFDQVVFPAFKGQRKRTFSDASYSLLDPTLIKFGDGELGISGRFVKDTMVERSQILVGGKIVQDQKSMESAPTSFFTLILSNHKLLYVRENSGAPSLSSFASTISLFLGEAYREWTREIYNKENETSRKVTWAQLREKYPPPILTITSLSSESSVSAFLEKFKTVNAVEIRLLETNHELDNSPIFGEMRDIKEQIGASNMVLRSQKAGDVGLNSANVAKLIGTEAGDGNTQITLKGKALNGEKLTANNDSFSVAITIAKLPHGIIAASDKVYEKLKNQLALGTISIKSGGQKALAKIESLIKARTWE
jgi:hypothetical protein